MNAFEYISDRYAVEELNYLDSPIVIPNIGRAVFGEWFRDLGFKVGAEVGVFRGDNAAKMLSIHRSLELHCIDKFEIYPGYLTVMKNPKKIPSAFAIAQEKLKSYNVHFIKEYSMEAVKRFGDCSLDFVYIDANHDLPWIMDDIIQWEKKVRVGGIVSGHDYLSSWDNRPERLHHISVSKALEWYTVLKPIPTWFVLGEDNARPGESRDKDRSWFWVKTGA